MPTFLKTRAFKFAAVAALSIALYAIAGFIVAPKIIRKEMLERIPQTLSVTPTVGEIRFNPFLFQLEMKDVALTGTGGEPLAGFHRLFVDFQLSSIWHRAYTFTNIDVDAPFVHGAVAQDGTLNLLQLRPKNQSPVPPGASAPVPSVRFSSFKVTQGTMTYEDRSRPSEFAARLEPINFELKDFTTGVQGGVFTFTGSSKLGERIEWHGHLSVQPIESDGEFRIDGLQAHTLWEYLEDRLNFLVPTGTIDLNATYRFALGDSPELQIDVAQFALKDLTLRPKDGSADWVALPELEVKGATVDLAKRQGRVDSVILSGLKLLTWLEPDGSVNLLKFAHVAASTRGTSTAATSPTLTVSAAPAGAAAGAAAAPWVFDLSDFAIRDASVSVEDRSTRPAAKVVLAPFSLQMNEVSSDLSKPVRVALDAKVNESGSLSVKGEVTPAPVSASLDLNINGIDLRAIQPYIEQHTSMTLLAGRLGAAGKVHYARTAQQPSLQFSGNAHVDGLHTVDNTLQDDFIDWARLDVLGIDYSLAPDRLDIAQIMARKLYARVIIEQDASLNITRILNIKPAAANAAGSPRAAAAAGTARAAASAPMPMSIKRIALQAGEANFTDLSVAPNFSAGIQKLEGTILGLSSKPTTRAKVDLRGSVGEFSPVSIKGEVNVLSAALFTDLAMDFRNMELSTFNPYSGKFAGYNITKGKLTTELHYKVDGRKLDAQHHIVIDQLEFGEKTASKDAVSLPIKLAVALLKDRNGIIDLELPVTGSLDDPQFRLGPIIWKVFVNILEKAVTAPFALLGSLFGGGPDLQFIDFQPGSAQLDAAASDKAAAVGKALVGRPQLTIEVPIAAVAEVDRPALVEARFKARLRTKGAADAPASAAFEQLDPTAQLEVLQQAYLKEWGSTPKYPDAVTGLKAKSDIVAAKNEFLSRAIREHIVVGDADLDALGEQRAEALQKALLADPQISAERVFLVGNEKAKMHDGAVRLELSLK